MLQVLDFSSDTMLCNSAVDFLWTPISKTMVSTNGVGLYLFNNLKIASVARGVQVCDTNTEAI